MKLVKEFLYEKFAEDSDPIEDMGIGIIKYIFKKLKEVSNLKIVKDITFKESDKYDNRPFLHIIYKMYSKISEINNSNSLFREFTADIFSNDPVLFNNPFSDVFIKSEYVDYFRQCFNKKGYLKKDL